MKSKEAPGGGLARERAPDQAQGGALYRQGTLHPTKSSPRSPGVRGVQRDMQTPGHLRAANSTSNSVGLPAMATRNPDPGSTTPGNCSNKCHHPQVDSPAIHWCSQGSKELFGEERQTLSLGMPKLT